MGYKISPGGGQRKFTPAPAGIKPCVVVDVIDLGWVKTTWKGVEKEKEMFRIVWQTPDTFEGSDGETLNYHVSQRYTRSLHENSNFRRDLEGMLGRTLRVSDITGADGEGFDVETLIGMTAYINIVHSDPVGDEGTIYANPKQIMPLPEGTEAPAINPSYIRKKDREEKKEVSDEDIPF